jgi:hypothetical protein
MNMARPWAWGVGFGALLGLTALCVGSTNATSHLVEIAPPVAAPPGGGDPACAPGPDYSAAVCAAASGASDVPIITAGADSTDPAVAATPPATPKLAANSIAASSSRTPAKVELASAGPANPIAGPPIAGKATPLRVASLTTPAAGGVTLQTSYALARGASSDIANFLRGQAAARLPRLSARFDPVSYNVQLRMRLDGLAKWLGQAQNLGDRARVYVFAGFGNRVLGYNLVHDVNGFGSAGWSMERAARIGDAQVGVALRRGDLGLALVGVQRKFYEVGRTVQDNMIGLRFTFSPGARRQQAG